MCRREKGETPMRDDVIVDMYWKREEAVIRETELKYGRYLAKIVRNILADEEDAGRASTILI